MVADCVCVWDPGLQLDCQLAYRHILYPIRLIVIVVVIVGIAVGFFYRMLDKWFICGLAPISSRFGHEEFDSNYLFVWDAATICIFQHIIIRHCDGRDDSSLCVTGASA